MSGAAAACAAIPRGERHEWARECRVEEITSGEALAGLESPWNALAAESDLDDPFLTYDWILSWWEAFGIDARPYVLLIREGGRPAAVAPLMRSTRRMHGLTVRCVESMANVHSQRWDVVATRDRERLLGVLWEHLRAASRDWDLLKLAQVPRDSTTLEVLDRLARKDGFLTGFWPSSASPYVSLEGGWEEYERSLRSKHRANLRNRLARLQKLGPVSVEIVDSEDGLEAALEDGFKLEAAAWKGSAGTAIQSRPETLRFYGQLSRRAAGRGWLRLRFLRSGQRRVAFHYDLEFRGRLYLIKPGFDPAYRPYSPSNLLCYLTLRDAFASGLREFDFLGDADDWKLDWTPRTRPHSWLFVFSGRMRPRLLHFVKFRVAPALRRWKAARGAGETGPRRSRGGDH